jgi:hypothetical protein
VGRVANGLPHIRSWEDFSGFLLALRLDVSFTQILGDLLCQGESFRQTPSECLDITVVALSAPGLGGRLRGVRQRWCRGEPEPHEQRQRLEMVT